MVKSMVTVLISLSTKKGGAGGGENGGKPGGGELGGTVGGKGGGGVDGMVWSGNPFFGKLWELSVN